jgi:hypothetical protein
MPVNNTYDRLDRKESMIPGIRLVYVTTKINLFRLYELARNKKRVKRKAELGNDK